MGRNCAEASSTNALVLLNQWCFVADNWLPFLSPLSLSLCVSLCLSPLPLLRHFLSLPCGFCSVVPFRGVTTGVREHTGGIYCSSGAQRRRCYMLYRYTALRIYCKTHTKHTVKGCSKGPCDCFLTGVPNLGRLN